MIAAAADRLKALRQEQESAAVMEGRDVFVSYKSGDSERAFTALRDKLQVTATLLPAAGNEAQSR